MGSPGVAAWVAHTAFWVLLATGIAYEELGWRSAGVFVALWLVGDLGLPRLAWWTASMVTSWVAVLDVVLVFRIFKGDVKLT